MQTYVIELKDESKEDVLSQALYNISALINEYKRDVASKKGVNSLEMILCNTIQNECDIALSRYEGA